MEDQYENILTYIKLRDTGISNESLDVVYSAAIKGRDLIPFLVKYPSLKPAQLLEIMDGLEVGLTTEQIMIYADPGFASLQMRQIKRALRSLGDKYSLNTMENILEYAKPEVDWHIMRDKFHLNQTYNIVYINGGNQND